MAKPDLKDYVDVPARIRAFAENYPDGSLQSIGEPKIVQGPDGRMFIWYGAMAYRKPDDPKPGVGWAAEPFPGTTPYTRNSELQNAETSAWGRAIQALGFDFGKIASVEEVRNRVAEGEEVASELRAEEAKVSEVSADVPSLSVDLVKALVADLDRIGIDRQEVKLWLMREKVKPAKSFEATLTKLTPEQAFELKAWAEGKREAA